MQLIYSLIIFFILLSLELLYFRIANHYNIIDKPNNRSSHTIVTIRGGGIVFVFSVLIFFQLSRYQYPLFLAGLILISLISFIDDILTLNNRVRLIVQLSAVSLLIAEWNLSGALLYTFPLLVIGIIGLINAYNFMDGINGITGIYSLTTILTLFYINENNSFTNSELLICSGLALIVFGVFNFRKKAKCFAGDVGSVSMAFILVFLLGSLILKTGDWSYLLLLLVYGLDTVITILFRLIRKERIFEAHRSHFYQYLANEKKKPHLLVAIAYSVCQLAVNIIVIRYGGFSVICIISIILVSAIAFITLRLFTEGKDRILKSNRNIGNRN